MAQIPLKAGLAALLMLSSAPAVLAQPYDAPEYPTPDYGQAGQDWQQSQEQARERYQEQQDENQQQEDQYQTDRQRYDEQRQAYDDQQNAYQQRRNAYEGARARYEADRQAYDDEYGAGAWDRYYYDHPDSYDARYGPGAWRRDFGNRDQNAYAYDRGAPANAYGPPADYRGSSCEQQRDTSGLIGGVIGAIAGGAIGSSVARGADRGFGTAAGAVLGGAVGIGVGRSAAACDDRGYYFSYNQTYPYREGDWERGRSGDHDYDWYASHGCRLASAPATSNGDTEYRWVRVCPDADGRYRITS